MLTVDVSRTGHKIFRFDGRSLSSSIDPVKEAQSWARAAVQNLRAGDTLFVLGLAAGYHVVELAKLIDPSRFLVIENNAEIVSQAFEILPELTDYRILVQPDWLQLVVADQFRDSLCGVYKVATFGPSFQLSNEYFAAVENLLIGRTHISFLLQLKARPGVWALLDPEQVEKFGCEIPSDTELVSIKTLQRLFSAKADGHRERQIWRVLEELVV